MVSIIIPAYNCENTVSATLDSILAQTEKDFEIILVDDGSTDGTVRSVAEWQSGHPEAALRLISQENGGPASARNRGISEAKGAYVVFTDADDTLRPNFLKTLLSGMEAGADFTYAPYYRITNGNVSSAILVGNPENGTDSPEDVFISLVSNKANIAMWNSMFRTSVILENGIRFLSGCRSGEDTEFVARYLTYCRSVSGASEPVYDYYYLPDRGLERLYRYRIRKMSDTVYWQMQFRTEEAGFHRGTEALLYGKYPTEALIEILLYAKTAESASAFKKSFREHCDEFLGYLEQADKRYLRSGTYQKIRLVRFLSKTAPVMIYRSRNILL